MTSFPAMHLHGIVIVQSGILKGAEGIRRQNFRPFVRVVPYTQKGGQSPPHCMAAVLMDSNKAPSIKLQTKQQGSAVKSVLKMSSTSTGN